jgi:hypothetical protein
MKTHGSASWKGGVKDGKGRCRVPYSGPMRIGARKREDLVAGASTPMHSLALRARAGWSPGRLRRLAAGTIRLVIGKDVASAARRR